MSVRILVGRARLMNGQVVPGLIPDLRGMNNWNTSALVSAVSSHKGSSKSSNAAEEIKGFLDRIYYGFQNLGLTSQDRRSLILQAQTLFNAAGCDPVRRERRHAVGYHRNRAKSVCRPESDGWDVKLVFLIQKTKCKEPKWFIVSPLMSVM